MGNQNSGLMEAPAAADPLVKRRAGPTRSGGLTPSSRRLQQQFATVGIGANHGDSPKGVGEWNKQAENYRRSGAGEGSAANGSAMDGGSRGTVTNGHPRSNGRNARVEPFGGDGGHERDPSVPHQHQHRHRHQMAFRRGTHGSGMFVSGGSGEIGGESSGKEGDEFVGGDDGIVAMPKDGRSLESIDEFESARVLKIQNGHGNGMKSEESIWRDDGALLNGMHSSAGGWSTMDTRQNQSTNSYRNINAKHSFGRCRAAREELIWSNALNILGAVNSLMALVPRESLDSSCGQPLTAGGQSTHGGHQGCGKAEDSSIRALSPGSGSVLQRVGSQVGELPELLTLSTMGEEIFHQVEEQRRTETESSNSFRDAALHDDHAALPDNNTTGTTATARKFSTPATSTRIGDSQLHWPPPYLDEGLVGDRVPVLARRLRIEDWAPERDGARRYVAFQLRFAAWRRLGGEGTGLGAKTYGTQKSWVGDGVKAARGGDGSKDLSSRMSEGPTNVHDWEVNVFQETSTTASKEAPAELGRRSNVLNGCNVNGGGLEAQSAGVVVLEEESDPRRRHVLRDGKELVDDVGLHSNRRKGRKGRSWDQPGERERRTELPFEEELSPRRVKSVKELRSPQQSPGECSVPSAASSDEGAVPNNKDVNIDGGLPRSGIAGRNGEPPRVPRTANGEAGPCSGSLRTVGAWRRGGAVSMDMTCRSFSVDGGGGNMMGCDQPPSSSRQSVVAGGSSDSKRGDGSQFCHDDDNGVASRLVVSDDGRPSRFLKSGIFDEASVPPARTDVKCSSVSEIRKASGGPSDGCPRETSEISRRRMMMCMRKGERTRRTLEQIHLTVKLSIAIEQGVMLFNERPSQGIQFLIAERLLLPDDPQDLAQFLVLTDGLSRQIIGNYIAGHEPFQCLVMKAFLDLFDFQGSDVEQALRYFLSRVHLRGEAQAIQRVVEAFSERFVADNLDSSGLTAEHVYLVSYALLILNTDLHNQNVKAVRMTESRFCTTLQNCQVPISETVLSEMYYRLCQSEFTSSMSATDLLFLKLARDPRTARRLHSIQSLESCASDMALLMEGGEFTKFCRQGLRHPRVVWLSHEMPYLRWAKPAAASSFTHTPERLSVISRLRSGKFPPEAFAWQSKISAFEVSKAPSKLSAEDSLRTGSGSGLLSSDPATRLLGFTSSGASSDEDDNESLSGGLLLSDSELVESSTWSLAPTGLPRTAGGVNKSEKAKAVFSVPFSSVGRLLAGIIHGAERRDAWTERKGLQRHSGNSFGSNGPVKWINLAAVSNVVVGVNGSAVMRRQKFLAEPLQSCGPPPGTAPSATTASADGGPSGGGGGPAGSANMSSAGTATGASNGSQNPYRDFKCFSLITEERTLDLCANFEDPRLLERWIQLFDHTLQVNRVRTVEFAACKLVGNFPAFSIRQNKLKQNWIRMTTECNEIIRSIADRQAAAGRRRSRGLTELSFVNSLISKQPIAPTIGSIAPSGGAAKRNSIYPTTDKLSANAKRDPTWASTTTTTISSSTATTATSNYSKLGDLSSGGAPPRTATHGVSSTAPGVLVAAARAGAAKTACYAAAATGAAQSTGAIGAAVARVTKPTARCPFEAAAEAATKAARRNLAACANSMSGMGQSERTMRIDSEGHPARQGGNRKKGAERIDTSEVLDELDVGFIGAKVARSSSDHAPAANSLSDVEDDDDGELDGGAPKTVTSTFARRSRRKIRKRMLRMWEMSVPDSFKPTVWLLAATVAGRPCRWDAELKACLSSADAWRRWAVKQGLPQQAVSAAGCGRCSSSGAVSRSEGDTALFSRLDTLGRSGTLGGSIELEEKDQAMLLKNAEIVCCEPVVMDFVPADARMQDVLELSSPVQSLKPGHGTKASHGSAFLRYLDIASVPPAYGPTASGLRSCPKLSDQKQNHVDSDPFTTPPERLQIVAEQWAQSTAMQSATGQVDGQRNTSPTDFAAKVSQAVTTKSNEAASDGENDDEEGTKLLVALFDNLKNCSADLFPFDLSWLSGEFRDCAGGASLASAECQRQHADIFSSEDDVDEDDDENDITWCCEDDSKAGENGMTTDRRGQQSRSPLHSPREAPFAEDTEGEEKEFVNLTACSPTLRRSSSAGEVDGDTPSVPSEQYAGASAAHGRGDERIGNQKENSLTACTLTPFDDLFKTAKSSPVTETSTASALSPHLHGDPDNNFKMLPTTNSPVATGDEGSRNYGGPSSIDFDPPEIREAESFHPKPAERRTKRTSLENIVEKPKRRTDISNRHLSLPQEKNDREDGDAFLDRKDSCGSVPDLVASPKLLSDDENNDKCHKHDNADDEVDDGMLKPYIFAYRHLAKRKIARRPSDVRSTIDVSLSSAVHPPAHSDLLFECADGEASANHLSAADGCIPPTGDCKKLGASILNISRSSATSPTWARLSETNCVSGTNSDATSTTIGSPGAVSSSNLRLSDYSALSSPQTTPCISSLLLVSAEPSPPSLRGPRLTFHTQAPSPSTELGIRAVGHTQRDQHLPSTVRHLNTSHSGRRAVAFVAENVGDLPEDLPAASCSMTPPPMTVVAENESVAVPKAQVAGDLSVSDSGCEGNSTRDLQRCRASTELEPRGPLLKKSSRSPVVRNLSFERVSKSMPSTPKSTAQSRPVTPASPSTRRTATSVGPRQVSSPTATITARQELSRNGVSVSELHQRLLLAAERSFRFGSENPMTGPDDEIDANCDNQLPEGDQLEKSSVEDWIEPLTVREGALLVLRALSADRKMSPLWQRGTVCAVGIMVYYMKTAPAFRLFRSLLCKDDHFLADFVVMRSRKVAARLRWFEELVNANHPELSSHFRALGLLPAAYFPSWVSSIFTTCLPLSVAVRLWDRVFCYPEFYSFSVGLALLSFHKGDLLTTSLAGCYELLSNKVNLALFDEEKFLAELGRSRLAVMLLIQSSGKLLGGDEKLANVVLCG